MKEISILFKDILKPILKNYSPLTLIIRRNWSNLMGEKYYEFCEPEKILFQKNKKSGGLLYITTFNNVISFYIENNKYFILEKINTIFGYNLIKDIKLKQNPKIIKHFTNKEFKITSMEEKKIINSVSFIKEDDLKESLKMLGEALYNKSSAKMI